MSFRMIHENYNVSDLDRSIKFYNDALDLHEVDENHRRFYYRLFEQ